SLPMFLLALPAGALADVLDRRRLLLVTQGWMLAAATGLGFVTLTGRATPNLLLLFTFLLGLGTALNGPAWQAIVPELVPREDLPATIVLNSVGFNIARAAGPALGGLIVATAGPSATFLLNAASFVGVLVVLVRWRRPSEEAILPAERFFGAMRTGVHYVRHAPELIAVIARGTAFVFCGSALWALLPLVAKDELHRGPGAYGLLLGALGVGAVAGAFALPRLKRNNSTDLVVVVATLVFAGGMLALGVLQSYPLLLLAMLLAGGGWLSALSSLNVAFQTAVPAWVRARALSVYLLTFYAGLAAGSALWGFLAGRFGLRAALAGAAAGMVITLLATARLHLRSGEGLNLAPSRQWPAPIVTPEPEPERGPILVTLEYDVDPAHAADFVAALHELGRGRLRDGAYQWGLFADPATPGRYVEIYLVSSWIEHLRQHERETVVDRELKRKVRGFQKHGGPPRVSTLIAERPGSASPEERR
ncbi:MAG TPA: MFS transporter, partial [Thermoanaerobaculia bacterium]|nr:MFS transporter [Thermoanaerobaculia bacterium]